MATNLRRRTRDIALAALIFLVIEPCRIASYPLAARCSLRSSGRGGRGGVLGRADVGASGKGRGRCGLPFQSRTGSCNVVLVPRWQCGRTIARAGDGGGGDSQDGGEGQVAEAATVAGDYEEEVEEGGDGQSSSLQFNRRGGPISLIASIIRSIVKFFARVLHSLFISKFSVVRRFVRGLQCDWLLAKRAWKTEMSELNTKIELDRRSALLKRAFEEDDEDTDMLDIVNELDLNGKNVSTDNVVLPSVSAREDWLRKGLGLGPDLTEEEIQMFIQNRGVLGGEEPRQSAAAREAAEEEELDRIVDSINAKSQRENWEKLARAGGAAALDDFREMMGVDLAELDTEDLAKWSNPEWLRTSDGDEQVTDVTSGDADEETTTVGDGGLTVDDDEKKEKTGEGEASKAELAVRGEVDTGGEESWVQTLGRGLSKAVSGVVPLIEAVEDGNEDGVKMLLAKGADVQETGWDGKNALQVAMELGDDRMVRMLVMGMQRRKARFISVDDVASKAQKDPREVYARANRGPRRGDARRRAFRAEDWQRTLSPKEFECLRLGRTEPPYSSPLHNETRAGVYSCAGCGTASFHSAFKFDSKEGYPSFFNAIANGIRVGDGRGVGLRREVLCSCCDSHLGFVWADGWMYPNCPVDTRFCINGAGMAFSPTEKRMSVD